MTKTLSFSRPDGTRFEIPERWWIEAGMAGFVPLRNAFPGGTTTEFTADLADIEPPRRNAGIDLDFQGFRYDRMLSVLMAFVSGTCLPPIPLVSGRSKHFKYVATDGFHRYHAAIAAGFASVPAGNGWLPEIP